MVYAVKIDLGLKKFNFFVGYNWKLVITEFDCIFDRVRLKAVKGKL